MYWTVEDTVRDSILNIPPGTYFVNFDRVYTGGKNVNDRLIWCHSLTGLAVSYISSTFSVDHYFSEYNSGAGLIIQYDLIKPSNIKTTNVGLSYSYELGVTKNLTFRPGLQFSYVNRRVDLSDLSFASQYSDNGFIGGSSNEDLHNVSVSYVDFSAGALLISSQYWLGASIHHMNRPNQSFIGGESILPAKTSIFGGYKFMLTPDWKRRYVNPDEEISISPTFMYKAQGKSDQLDLGLYGRYNMLVLGLWYRSIPVKVYKPDRLNHDALIFLIGLILKNGLQMGYSFDFTTSKLSMATWGSHEITLSYRIKSKNNKKIQKRPVCPHF